MPILDNTLGVTGVTSGLNPKPEYDAAAAV